MLLLSQLNSFCGNDGMHSGDLISAVSAAEVMPGMHRDSELTVMIVAICVTVAGVLIIVFVIVFVIICIKRGQYVIIIVQARAFLARDVIYTSRAYATMSVSVCLSVCPSVCDGSALAHYG